MLKISNKEYRAMDGVSSSVLKLLLKSAADLEYVIKKGWPQTSATILGDAIHAYCLEPERFTYVRETEYYKRAYGDFKAGDPKLDDDGNPLQKLTHPDDHKLDITGDQLKKFDAMIEAINKSPEALEIINGRHNVEMSFFSEVNGVKIKVRDDCMYKDADGHVWIVDIKTVGDTSAPKSFARKMFDFGYDLQAYMYTEVIKQEMPEVYGFKFLCIDACIPSGVKIYDVIPGESEWYELGGYRFHDALERYKRYVATDKHVKYEQAVDRLDLSFEAADALTTYRGSK